MRFSPKRNDGKRGIFLGTREDVGLEHYGGNPKACAAACSTLHVFEEKNIL